MSVQIADPPDNSAFPYDEGWTATATIGSNDAVDGVLIDYNTNEVYPSPGPSGNGPDADGLYTWQVPFSGQDLSDIKQGHSLVIYCYDAEIDGDGATCEDIASQDGSVDQKQAPLSTIVINPPTLVNQKFSGTVQLPPNTKGGVFLVLANRTGDIRKHTRRILVCALPASGAATPYTFEGVNGSKWTHIHVVAVTYRHQSSPPAVYTFQAPKPALLPRQKLRRDKRAARNGRTRPPKRTQPSK